MIELRHLKTLLALKESGSLAAAAGKRFVTQSALSHQIKELETRIDAPLFIRKSKPLRFTPEGQKLVDLAETIMPMVVEQEQQLRQGLANVSQTLVIGVESYSCYRWLKPLMEQFRAKYPQVDIELTAKFKQDSLEALEQGELDMVLTSDSASSTRISYQHLFDYQMDLVMSPQHPLAEKSYIVPQDLAGETLISYPVAIEQLDVVNYFMQPSGIDVAAQKQCELTMMMLQRVASGDGVSALPSWALADGVGMHLTSRPLGAKGLQRALYAALPAASPVNRYVEAWLELVCQQATIKDKRKAA
ncbi:LysR family transcriptional regulator [Paraferrimonas haliotis]|uniref:LysR family transcriptional regulator n=1 Tax=Paraferrimonas haliotis TaxID=2013866 RepID=A0AA37WWK7_9GAMM|nr:LysR family transcriptional regulator [Paraferrimonas haliotis]GLS83612.1 LysR family transcriptional regulator [Paraferrimonas haliotis]